jgi:hypothetical protein
MLAIIGRLNVRTTELDVLTPVVAAAGDTEKRYAASGGVVASVAHPVKTIAARALLEARRYRM